MIRFMKSESVLKLAMTFQRLILFSRFMSLQLEIGYVRSSVGYAVDLRTFLTKKIHYFFASFQLGCSLSTQDEETGAWYQHKGRDFKVPLVNDIKDDANIIGPKTGFSLGQGNFEITMHYFCFFSKFYFVSLKFENNNMVDLICPKNESCLDPDIKLNFNLCVDKSLEY